MLEGKDARVMRIEKKRRARHPGAPFTTSTLQQAGVRQLGMTTDRVMRTAQQLYEGIDLGEGPVGLITYMRTDSVNLAQEAITDIRKYVGTNFDKEFLPPAAIAYKAKTKNAQEAHEAVRPTSVMRTPEAVKPFLSHDQARLYELIWKRTVSCQMTPAQFDTVAADITVGEGTFRATGQPWRSPAFWRCTRTTRTRKANRNCQHWSKAKPCRSTSSTANSTSPSRRRAHRSQPGESARGIRHRPAFHLRQHHFHAAGSRIRDPGKEALSADRHRSPGQLLPHPAFQPLRRLRLHRQAGRQAR